MLPALAGRGHCGNPLCSRRAQRGHALWSANSPVMISGRADRCSMLIATAATLYTCKGQPLADEASRRACHVLSGREAWRRKRAEDGSPPTTLEHTLCHVSATGIRSTSEFAVVYAKLGTKKIAQSTSTSKLHLTSASRTSLQASHGAKVPLLPQVPALKLRRVPRTVRRLH